MFPSSSSDKAFSFVGHASMQSEHASCSALRHLYMSGSAHPIVAVSEVIVRAPEGHAFAQGKSSHILHGSAHGMIRGVPVSL